MSSSFSLQEHSQSPLPHELTSVLGSAVQLLNSIEFLPLLLAEVNKHGLAHPDSLSMLVKRLLSKPNTDVFLSFEPTTRVHPDGIECWRFDELNGLQAQVLPVSFVQYEELCERPLLVANLSAPGLESFRSFVHLFFSVSCHALICIPLTHRGQRLATLHVTLTDSQSFASGDFFWAQIIAEVLTLALGQEKEAAARRDLLLQEQEGQMQQMAALTRQNAALQQELQALVKGQEDLAQLRLQNEYLARENQEYKKATINRALYHGETAPQSASKTAPKVDPVATPGAPPSPEERMRYVATTPPLPPGGAGLTGPEKPPLQSVPGPVSGASDVAAPSPKPPSGAAPPKPKGLGLSLPPIESLRNAFQPSEKGVNAPLRGTKAGDAGKTAELLLVDVIGEQEEIALQQQAAHQQIAAELMADIEFDDEPIAQTPTMLCLSDTSSAALRSLGRIVQLFGFELKPASTMQHLLEIAEVQPPTLIGLTTSQIEKGSRLMQLMEQGILAPPMFEAADDDDDQELLIALHWAGYKSAFRKDTFWHGWLRRTFDDEFENTMLIVGEVDIEQLRPIGEFLLGAEHKTISHHSPVDGIQVLYQQPPRLLVLQLTQDSEHWVSLLPELSRSVRLLEIPILLLGPVPLSGPLLQVLQPFKYLSMTLASPTGP